MSGASGNAVRKGRCGIFGPEPAGGLDGGALSGTTLYWSFSSAAANLRRANLSERHIVRSDPASLISDACMQRGTPFAGVVLAIGIALCCTPSSTFAGPLHDAVRAQDKSAIDELLTSGVPVNQSDFVLGTALHVSVVEGNTEIARTLINHGADVEAVSEQQGSRSVHLAAQFGNAPMVALLLDNGADIEARDDFERTPLLRAAAAGHAEAVQLLLDRGAKIDAREGRHGETPLHEAAHQGRFDVVKLLIERGAEVDAVENSGYTPFWVAAFPQSYNQVGDASLLEYLLAAGADPNVRDNSGRSILAYAELQARQGAVVFAEIANQLRRLGATE